MNRESLRDHLAHSTHRSITTFWWLVKIMVPASAAVFILERTGILALLGNALEPVMSILGLPGGAALAVISSVVVNLYAVIAIAVSLELTVKQLVILSLLCLVAHNYLVELAVTRKTGTPVVRMFLLRTAGALILAVAMAWIIPEEGMWVARAGGMTVAASTGSGTVPLLPALQAWATALALLLTRVVVIVVGLTFATRLLQYYGIMQWIAHHLRWLMWLLGLPAGTGPAWIIANTLGLAYGAAVLTEEVETGRFTAEEGDLLNHHLGVSHSLLEDTMLFAAIGAPVPWLVVPRVILAVLAVWERKLERWIRRHRARRHPASHRNGVHSPEHPDRHT